MSHLRKDSSAPTRLLLLFPLLAAVLPSVPLWVASGVLPARYTRGRFCKRFAATEAEALSSEAAGLEGVLRSIDDAAAGRLVRLVAVSKTKSAAAVQAAHDAGQIDFGENYVQELLEKAPKLSQAVRWRFIGRLQSNKVRKLLAGVPNLAAIETVDSASLADRIAAVAAEQRRGIDGKNPLDVFIQVDTSNEETKGGLQPEDVEALALHITRSCTPSLRLAGLMTIGAPGDVTAFDRLRETRDDVAATLGVPPEQLDLSMGMSGDFQEAIRRGATSVRVGSLIFGARPPKLHSS